LVIKLAASQFIIVYISAFNQVNDTYSIFIPVSLTFQMKITLQHLQLFFLS